MHFEDLHSYLDFIDSTGDLIRLKNTVDPYLEVAAIINRVCKDKENNHAILFERIKGSNIPLIANVFGSEDRMNGALGVTNVDLLSSRLSEDLNKTGESTAEKALVKIVKNWTTLNADNFKTGTLNYTECGNKLAALPALQSWPNDGGRYITLGQVFTRNPDTGVQNCGMYRIQVMNKDRALIRFHGGSGGGQHLHRWQKHGLAMPITIVLGGPPALTWCAGISLPDNVAEIDFTRYLLNKPIGTLSCLNSDLKVPDKAEIVIEGTITSEEMCMEGPFGNHTGSYSEPALAPVIRVQNVYMRDNAIYPCTVVGQPPMENVYMAQASERILLAMLRYDCPWVTNVHMPLAGIYHRAAIVTMSEQNSSVEEIIEKLSMSLLLKNSRLLVLADDDYSSRDFNEIYWRIVNIKDWSKNVTLTNSKMIIDARTMDKSKLIKPSLEINERIMERWSDYGLN